ncbi:MAG: hypothetical protein M3R51_08610 [Candidatus Eremiobacteraeota bacterium]|nr:hypothetical protein [Candidatus Eremiobacteraeota bacterium]
MNEPTTKDILDALLGFRDAVELRFNAIDLRLDKNDRRFDGIDRRLDGIDRRLDRIEHRLDSHDRHSLSLEAKVDDGLSDVRQRLTRLEAQRA